MAKKKVAAVVKIQIPAGAGHARRRRSAPRSARTAWRSWTSARRTTPQTEAQRGTIVPVEITIFEDRSFTFITKTPPTPVLLREAAGLDKGVADARARTIAGTVTDGPGRRDRQDQDARPQRQRPRGGQAAGRRHRPLDGHRGRAEQPPTSDTATGERPRPGAVTTRGSRAHGEGQEVHRRGQAVRPRPAAHAPTRRSTWSRAWPPAKFDETVELAVRLGVDPRKADQMVRGTVALPVGHRQGRPRRGVRPGRRRRRGPRPPAPTSSAPTTSPPRSRAACSTSTSPSPRPTSCPWSAGSAGCSAPGA